MHLYISISFIWAYEGFSFLSLPQADSHPERQTELQSCVLLNNFTSVSLSASQTCGVFNVTSVILDDSSYNLKGIRENWLKKIKKSYPQVWLFYPCVECVEVWKAAFGSNMWNCLTKMLKCFNFRAVWWWKEMLLRLTWHFIWLKKCVKSYNHKRKDQQLLAKCTEAV